MWHRILLAGLSLTLAQPAAALSCLRPDVVRLYEDARDSPDLYSMVIATFPAETTVRVPQGNQGTASGGTMAETILRLTGRGLTSAGFTHDFDRDITVRAGCLSAWCAAPPATGTEVFVTLRHKDETLVLDLGPCLSNALPWTAEDEARVMNCHRFGKCAIAE